jgi:hypothetical protein
MDINFMYTSWFSSNYAEFNTAKQVGIRLYTQTPSFTDTYQASVFSGITALSGLNVRPEWVQCGVTPTSTPSTINLKSFNLGGGTGNGFQFVGTVSSVANTVLNVEAGQGWILPTDSQIVIAAVVVYAVGTFSGVVNPVLFATTAGIGDGTIVAHGGSIYGQSKAPVLSSPNDTYIASRDSISGKFSVGYSFLNIAAPVWEPPHSQHVWIQPQRINFIANPSFESATLQWRSGIVGGTGTASLEQTSGGVDVQSPVRTKCGHVSRTGTGGKIVLESNLFPSSGPWYSVSFSISSSSAATVEFGLVAHDYAGLNKTFIKAPSVSVASGGSAAGEFVRMTALIKGLNDIKHYSFRIESTSSEFWVDNVLVDPHEGQDEYFDGNSTNTISGDYRWMGGTEGYANKHFSLWYNNFNNSYYRLVGKTVDNTYKGSLYQEWAPTGAAVMTHWDAVTSFSPLNWKGDFFYPITDVSSLPISTISSTIP